MQLNIVQKKSYVLVMYKLNNNIESYLIPRYTVLENDFEILEDMQCGSITNIQHIEYVSNKFGIFGKWEKYKTFFPINKNIIKDIEVMYLIERDI